MKRLALIVLAVFALGATACTPAQIAQYQKDHDVRVLPHETPTTIIGNAIKASD